MIVSGVGRSAAGEPPSYVLDSSGDVSLPNISRLHLAGLTLQQAAKKIEDAYVPEHSNQFFFSAVKRCH